MLFFIAVENLKFNVLFLSSIASINSKVDRTHQLYLIWETVSGVHLQSLNPLIIFIHSARYNLNFFIIQSFLTNVSKLIFLNCTKIK